MYSDFIADKIVMEGLTFDDVLLVPAYSEVLPRTVSLSTKFSRPLDFFGHTAACCTEYLCTFVGAYRFFTWATLPNGVHYLITTTTIT